MTDDQLIALWREMRPIQGDPDPVRFAKVVQDKATRVAHRDERKNMRFALASALGWPGGISVEPPALDLLLQEVAARCR